MLSACLIPPKHAGFDESSRHWRGDCVNSPLPLSFRLDLCSRPHLWRQPTALGPAPGLPGGPAGLLRDPTPVAGLLLAPEAQGQGRRGVPYLWIMIHLPNLREREPFSLCVLLQPRMDCEVIVLLLLANLSPFGTDQSLLFRRVYLDIPSKLGSTLGSQLEPESYFINTEGRAGSELGLWAREVS